MQSSGAIRLLALVGGLVCAATAAQAQSRKVPESLLASAASVGHQRVIVLLAPAASGDRRESARQPERHMTDVLRETARMVRGIGQEPMVVAEVSSAGLARLERDPSVRRVVPDALMSAFLPESTRQIHAPELWSKATAGDGVAVAVLDTGVQRDHPFIASHLTAEACFSSNSPSAGSASLCPNGQNEQIGAGAAAACDYRSVAPNCVHGAHVAGIAAGAAGRNGAAELNGVAPRAKIIPVQVFSRFEGEQRCGKGRTQCVNAWTSDVIRGLLYVERIASQQKVAAVNLSLGGGRFDSACDGQSAYADIINRLTGNGVAVVAAAGNNAYAGAVTEPACVSAAVTVGAVDKTGKVDARYSNTSPAIDLLAPGTQILSSAAGGYHKLDGTSMAAPHVAGLFALLKSRHPEAGVADMLAAIQASGRQVADPRGGSFALPDAEAALARLDGAGAAPKPPKPGDRPGKPAPDPRISGCGPVCVEAGARRVIFVLASRDPVSAETLRSLQAAFGRGAKIADLGDGKLSVELPEGVSQDDVDRARRKAGDGARVLPDHPLETLQPGGRVTIR